MTKNISVSKRHLSSMYGIPLKQYKARRNLSNDYQLPPSYTCLRSAVTQTQTSIELAARNQNLKGFRNKKYFF